MDPFQNPSPHSRPSSAAVWGLASLLAAGFLFLGAFPGLQFILALETGNFHTILPRDMPRTAYGGYAAIGVLLALSLIAVAMGFVSMAAAWREQHPSGLGVFGALLGMAAVGLWIAAGLAWHSSVSWRLQGLGGG